MVTEQLISPKSIVVVGGSEDTTKPGGSALKNLIDNKFSGKLYVVNPKAENVQWQKTYKSVEDDEKKCYITGQTNNLHRHH